VVIVAFPFRYQLGAWRERSLPQAILGRFARERGIPLLDLLPILVAEAAEHNEAVDDYYVDETHPSVLGTLRVATAIAGFLEHQL
jgi:lysophospholipase L1-like esterase